VRQVSDRTAQALADGGYDVQWVFDLMYDGDRRLANVEVERAPALTWDGTRFVVGTGTSRVVWTDDHARSLIPREIGDWFSPFGAEMQVDCLIGGGVFTERVPTGRFVITDVPDAVEARMLWEGRLIHPGEAFTVELKDPLVRVQRDDFAFPTAPATASTWNEVQAITGLPVIRNVPDAAVPTVTYEGSREEAVKTLFDRIDAWPHMDSTGALTARPKSWPNPVGVLRNVVAAPSSMTSTYTYNRVVVVGKSPTGDALYGVREVTSGFLRVRNENGSQSPYGGATYRYASDMLTTQEQVDAYAAELLPRVARIRSVTRQVTVAFNPLIEVGDVQTFADAARFGGDPVRVQRVIPGDGVTSLTVEVPDAG
jgi:hypothetical protein